MHCVHNVGMAPEKSPLAAVDANLLVVLDAILSEGNVGRAARRVGLSASAVSHALARIRAVLGDPVIVRAGAGMVLTPRAQELAPSLREGVRLLSGALAQRRAFSPGDARGTLRVAAVDFAHHVLRPFVPALRREAPLLDVVVTPFVGDSLDSLATGEVDLAFAAFKRPRRGLFHRVVLTERFVCVARKGHPALRARLTTKRFAALEHVMVSPRGRTSGATDVALKRVGLRRRVVLVMPTLIAAALAVADSDLVLTCAERSAEQVRTWLDLEVFAPPLKLEPSALGMFWHARTEDDPLHVFVRDRFTTLSQATTSRPRE